MEYQTMEIIRKSIILKPNPKRVICKFLHTDSDAGAKNIIDRVMSLNEDQILHIHNSVFSDFNKRHINFEEILESHYNKISHLVYNKNIISKERKQILGAYFSMEYSFESSALFNPSIVIYPEQNQQSNRDCKFIMSLRGVGEGHISSLIFASGKLNAFNEIEIDEISPYADSPRIIKHPGTQSGPVEIIFDNNSPVSQRIIFPITDEECNGIEDVRLVRFISDSGSVTYFGTYTAYDGKAISVKLLETTDFLRFKMHKLNGSAVKDKGMALFPRKINGKYAMISRQDGENLYIMYSNDILVWQEMERIKIQHQPWEFVKLGNCGSPIETDKGWLLLTHGVGAIRKYSIGALLLDLNNPVKVIARLEQPLLSPNESEREGYVPNVVYSCGGIIRNQELIMPYALSDYASGIITIKVDNLLDHFV
jgi:predicted GH43/DUF377 family glycosyl hydrolase